MEGEKLERWRRVIATTIRSRRSCCRRPNARSVKTKNPIGPACGHPRLSFYVTDSEHKLGPIEGLRIYLFSWVRSRLDSKGSGFGRVGGIKNLERPAGTGGSGRAGTLEVFVAPTMQIISTAS